MRIFIIARGYPTEQYATNGIFEYDQAKALAAFGHEVIFLAVDLRSIRRKRPLGRESLFRDGVHIEAVNLPCGKLPSGLLFSLGSHALRRLYTDCKETYGVPDIIHSHFHNTAYITYKALKEEPVSKVITEHSSLIHRRLVSDCNKNRFRKAYQAADRVIAVSSSLAKVLQEEYQTASTIIPNLADLDTFKDLSLPHRSDRQTPYRFLSAGSLRPAKGTDLTIRAFRQALDLHPDMELYIAGEGPERPRLEQLIQELHLESHVKLLGQLRRTELCSQFLSGDCYVLASRSETFGVSYIEAMSTGLPVIATRCGGPEDFVSDETGILVDTDNVNELTDAMLYMLAHSRERFDPQHIRNYVRANYSDTNIARKLTDLYNEIL